MKALDTNILARFLRDDDAAQSRRATQYIQAAIYSGEPLYLNQIVLCELSWILTSVYEHSKEDIVALIGSILLTGQFRLEDKPLIEAALEDYKSTKADFADCLIGRRNHAAGCDSTLTFDRNLRTLSTFELR
jgi:predicted nucleic-acid-binding protein